ncbi:neutrophilic granule protein-like isoform X2 [Dromiciops gliroides]|uniref:neutrophilic granule protein-like isoform X2 n=1 Tax=Dromiciops gliroides TaxID=33562 RepID=UPI001CC76A0E|nr:neutrophilic granule protein-like isoform X2 [Dromiciops gliroides]
MGNPWRVLLLLLGLAIAVRAIPRRRLTFKNAAVLATRKFNLNLREGARYRVLESSLSTPNSPLVLPLAFRIKETECPSSERQNPETCAFRENGTVDFKASSLSDDIDTKSLPPRIRQMYDQTKFDIITNILRNF